MVSYCMATVVRLGERLENTLDYMIEIGMFKTKAEAIRLGILELAAKYGILDELKTSELAIEKMKKIHDDIRKAKEKQYLLKK